jgi:histidinol phosphatase-like enzyme
MGIIAENEARYTISDYVKEHYADNITLVILPERTTGPADTVYQIIKQANINLATEILIKDCDSFFEHEYQEGNYVCVSSIKDHEVLKKLGSKSFIVSNDQGIITSIIEKQVVSDKFCVGGYKFASAGMFVESYDRLNAANVKEIFVSHVIEQCLNEQHIFKEAVVYNYNDVGTAEDWFDYNDKSVVFCDIDGTIIVAQNRQKSDTVIPLENNIARVKQLIANGGQVIFTTARPENRRDQDIAMLKSLGFDNFQLISGLRNSKRILINDYNEANPYPRAVAVNLKRDSDNLSDFI